jgi:hypothetical protein
MRSTFCAALALIGVATLVQSFASADPLPGEVLKFQQLPLNNTLMPAFPTPSPVGAPYPGHDETSTVTPDGVNSFGTYMADDFADKFATPVVHVRWWGSYNQNFTGNTANPGVKQFLISFEDDVPKNDPTNTTGYSHPGTPLLTQIVSKGALAPGSGTFTEKLIPTPAIGAAAPPEALYEYNAELNLGKEFQEHPDTVYWLKIVAMVNPQLDGPISWGWHDRDWSIPDPLASTAPAESPGEDIIGTVPGVNGAIAPVWHFQDDAVQGPIAVFPDANMPIMPRIQQGLGSPQTYKFPADGPEPIAQFSKDLAFELYTRVPEPSTLLLMGFGGLALCAAFRRRK